jgi:hypothetical protein
MVSAILLGLVGALAVTPAGLAQENKQEKPKKERTTQKPKEEPAALAAFAEDKGRFRVVVDGQPAGTEEFQISRVGSEWAARGAVDITAGGAKLTSHLRLRGDGTPVKYEFELVGQDGKRSSAGVAFEGGTARIETQSSGAPPFTQEFFYETARVVILDNNLYHHYALLVGMFDWKAKGAQTFQVLIPQDLTPGSITLEYLGQQEIGGTKLEALRMRSADLEVFLYVDSNRRLMRLVVPDSKAEVIRE